MVVGIFLYWQHKIHICDRLPTKLHIVLAKPLIFNTLVNILTIRPRLEKSVKHYVNNYQEASKIQLSNRTDTFE